MTPFDKIIVAIAIFLIGIITREGFRLLFDRILKKNGNGNGVVKYLYVTRNDVKEVFEDTLKADILPLLNRQTDILQSLAITSSTLKDSMLRLTILSEQKS